MFGSGQRPSQAGVYHISSSNNYYGRAGRNDSRAFDIQNRLPTYNELFYAGNNGSSRSQTPNVVVAFHKPSMSPMPRPASASTAMANAPPPPAYTQPQPTVTISTKAAESTLSTVENI